MKKTIIFFFLFLLFASPVEALSPEKILLETNKYRQKHDLAPYEWNDDLAYAAQIKSQCIVFHEHFAHEPVDYNGNIRCTVEKLLAHAGYTWNTYGENLAMGDFETEEELVTAWYNSPGHKANLISPDHTEMGVGLVEDVPFLGVPSNIYTQEFASPGTGTFTQKTPTETFVFEDETVKVEPVERSWRTRLAYFINKLFFWR